MYEMEVEFKHMSCWYRIAGKFGVEFNLADFSKTAKFNSANRSTFVMKQ